MCAFLFNACGCVFGLWIVCVMLSGLRFVFFVIRWAWGLTCLRVLCVRCNVMVYGVVLCVLFVYVCYMFACDVL